MPTLTIEYETDAERLALEQAIAFVTDLRRLALAAPSGTVLDACEALAVSDGRQLLCDSLTAAVQARADAADAKKMRPAAAAKAPARNLPTALGLDGALTRAAERMAVFASARLVRPRQRRPPRVDRVDARPQVPPPAHPRHRPPGSRRRRPVRPRRRGDRGADRRRHGEHRRRRAGRDGGGHWQAAAGAPAAADDWANRRLPAPTVRTVVASVEDSTAFADRVRAETDRLGVTTAADVTVLGDGAEWIGNLADAVLPRAAGVQDYFHVAEKIGDAVTAIWGESELAVGLRAGGTRAVLRGGKAGLERWIGGAFGVLSAGHDGEPLRKLAADIAPHPTHLGYADRLAGGRSIGRGQVEGAIEQLVARRLKLTGVRWRSEHVGPLVELVALVDSPDWDAVWTAA